MLLTTCDKTRKIIPAQQWLLDKYIKYPFDYKYIDLKSENVKTWSTNILEKINHIKDEFVGFGLDDYLPICKFDAEIFDYMIDLMKKDPNIVRYEIGHSLANHTVIKKEEDFVVKEISQNADYRMSCQISIWRTDYLLDKLSNICSPWRFETKSSQLAKNDGKRMILTDNRWALRWIRHSALSGKWSNNINVLGLRLDDIKAMIDNHLLNEKNLQYGPFRDNVLYFNDIGYKFNFKDLKKGKSNKAYNDLHRLFSFNYIDIIN